MPKRQASGPEIRVYVPRELHAELVARARQGDRPVTREFVRAVRAYLADYDRLQAILEQPPQSEDGPA